MAVIDNDPRNPRIQTSNGSIPQIVYGHDEDASESFKAGEFVYMDASGQVNVLPDSSGGTNPVFGIAMKAATNTSASSAIEIPVQLITPETEVLIQVADDSGSLEASNTTCVPGVAYDLQKVSTNLHYINSGDTTNPVFVYLGPVYDTAGAVTYWGRFRLKYVESQATAE
jgi:hypothetical protein